MNRKFTYGRTCPHTRDAIALPDAREKLALIQRSLKGIKFEAFAVSGLSGIVLASVLAHRMRKALVIVRKEETPSPNSYNKIEGPDDLTSFVVLDDLISSGGTLRRIVEGVAIRYPHAKGAGVFLYAQAGRWRYEDLAPDVKALLGPLIEWKGGAE
jgi:adenine/guanine phosphoribosyltransferase-like PRPP-binding protein